MSKKNEQLLSVRKIREEKARGRLIRAAGSTQDALFRQYGVDFDGYTSDAADEVREKYGKNEISRRRKDGVPKRLFRAFINPFTIVLLVLAVVSFITDVVIVPAGKKDPHGVIIIAVMVTISGLLRFIQESRSGKAAEKLSAMVKTTIAVQRKPEGLIELPIGALVAGDIVHFAAGDMVPADVRILQAKDLFIGQSSLTGESSPVEKFGEAEALQSAVPLEYKNLAFMGSNVISGSAAAIVINVGDTTFFGSMAKDITAKKAPTSFEKGVNSVSWVLIRFMLVMVPCVLLLNGFTKGDWMESLLFALSVAVGLTPEMLPMLVSANLARGAVAMSKQKVVVKDLNSIQNLGAMDVLCTDKTGTLTQDKVVLMYPLDIRGQKDESVLQYAFLNSFWQTGLKNLMDVAVIEYIQNLGLQKSWDGYRKVDEIPFDFNRRRMSVVISDPDGSTQLITKGAIDEMLSVCSSAEYQGRIELVTEAIREEILKTVEQYNSSGMRVLAVAQKMNPVAAGAFSVADEKDLVLMGYLAFLDPPKESTAAAVKSLHEYGVDIKILTGDNDAVTRSICGQVGIEVENLLLGPDIESMSEEQLGARVESVNVFARLSPQQKARVVTALRKNGHTAGFMGDGINDAAAMRAADVGISVDTAVDIARETANIILLEKDLMVLGRGVIEGRKTYANIIKYIKMTASSNFGNMFSVLIASAFLPFLPMMPVQILMLNLIYDISCLTIPWDNVDKEFLIKPRKWNASSISKFMFQIGPVSSLFDVITFLLMFLYICPKFAGGTYGGSNIQSQGLFISLFQTGWFVESLWSQTLVIHMIRTPKIPFIQSRASWQLTILTLFGIAAGTLLPFTVAGAAINMTSLPFIYFPCLIAIVLSYMILCTVVKKVFVKRYGELL